MEKKISDLIYHYDKIVKGVETTAKNKVEGRAYGGKIRAEKGKLVEFLAKELILISWEELGGKKKRISFNSNKLQIPINKDYLEKLKDQKVKNFIEKNIKDYCFNARSDIHVFIDNKFSQAIECKSYTENAMIKRILVDFTLLKKVVNNKLDFFLFQLESQLTGDYSQIYNDTIYGSKPTHTLISHFDINLIIITLLEGERRVNKEIHKQEYFKKLTEESLSKTINIFKDSLKKYI